MMTVEEVIAKVFKIDSRTLVDGSGRDSIEQWDSMGHLQLITELEQHFGVSVSIGDAMEMVSVGKVKEILRRYGAGL
jgi:acyl carrier protein